METKKPNKGGRPALADPAKHRHVLYLNDRENARFLSLWEQSGVTSKSRFIAARLFGDPFRVVKVDKSAVEYCARLTEFYAQFRAVAVNYNQIVKALHSNFSEKNRHKAQRKAKFYINKCRSASCMQSGWKRTSA